VLCQPRKVETGLESRPGRFLQVQDGWSIQKLRERGNFKDLAPSTTSGLDRRHLARTLSAMFNECLEIGAPTPPCLDKFVPQSRFGRSSSTGRKEATKASESQRAALGGAQTCTSCPEAHQRVHLIVEDAQRTSRREVVPDGDPHQQQSAIRNRSFLGEARHAILAGVCCTASSSPDAVRARERA
jgi:hypothetical protein